ncbi:MAG: serine hydrolase [Phormidesmis sp.]
MTDANGTRNPLNGSANGSTPGPTNVSANGSPNSSPQSRFPTRPAARNAAHTVKARRARRSRRDSASQRSSQRLAPGKAVEKVAGKVAGKTATDEMRGRRGEVKTARLGSRASKVTPLNSADRATGRENKSRLALSKVGPPGRVLPARSLARRRHSRRSLPAPLLYFSRLAIAGLGIAAIGGTLLTVLPNGDASSPAVTESVLASAPEPVATFPMALNQELAALKSQLLELPNLYPGLTPKAFYIDVDTGDYVNLEGSDAIAAASTIKLPLLLAFFEEIDAGRINANQTLALLPEQVAEGSGEMQFSKPGSQFTALEVATQMIVGSDNTATNMMIDLLGGSAALNKRFEAYGLEKTRLVSSLPDLEGTNLTSARDLVHTMLLISQGDSLTMRSRDRILNILSRTYNKSLIPFGLEDKGALTYNKTGDIESVLGDVALVDLPNGKRYAIAILVERPANDGRAVELIHRISQRSYQETDKVIQPAVTPLDEVGSELETTEIPTENTGENLGENLGEAVSEPADTQVLDEAPYPSANPPEANPEIDGN